MTHGPSSTYWSSLALALACSVRFKVHVLAEGKPLGPFNFGVL